MVRGSSSGTLSEKQSSKKLVKEPSKGTKSDGKGNKKKETLQSSQCSLTAQCYCCDCGKAIHDHTNALNCEKCEKIWKCTTCLGLDERFYLELIEVDSLHWFCECCEVKVLKFDAACKDDKIMGMICELMEQVSKLDDKLERKMDVLAMQDFEKKI